MDNTINFQKHKDFRELSEQYKSAKFYKLYSKMYEYIISIPKEKIKIKENEYIRYLFRYISKFLEAKDFYRWKDRLYSLLTEKHFTGEYKRFELLYNSKAKEFHDRYITKQAESSKKTCLKRYGKKYYTQTDECKEKQKTSWENKTKEEKEQILKKKKSYV